MSAERPKGESAIPLTSKQTEIVAEEITKKWNGESGIRLDGGTLEKLIEIYGPDTPIAQILDKIKSQKKQ
ncbi:MAG: hypothetical protein KatS3mg088_273 [Patescibacteria group bacterium]|nr:MAG: hypothetical protein KatS3mg088_273 [Patescibacteria group bacterium]